MSFLGFRKRGGSRRRIRDKLLGRTSNYVGKEDASPSRSPSHSPSRSPSQPPWGFLFPNDFVRIDGNLKAVIVDENGLDVIYWRRLLDMENREKIRNPRDHSTRVTRGREAGGGEFQREGENGAMGEEIDEGFHRGSGGEIGDESIGDDFLFRMRKSEASSSVGEVRDYEYDRTRYHPSTPSSSSSALPPEASQVKMNSYGAVGISNGQDQLASSSPPPPSPPRNMGGPLPPLPLPPGKIAAATPAPGPAPAPVAPPPPISSSKVAGPPPPPPPPIPGKKGPGPPPPPSKSGPPSKPPVNPKESTSLSGAENGGDQSKPKLKPLHWDKVNPDAGHSMVWHRLEGGSFNFDGDLMEALFGYVATSRKSSEGNTATHNPIVSTMKTYILDPRKSQNKAIVLKSLGMTKDEIIDLLTEGHDVDAETLEKLTRIAPTQEEQLEILEFDGEPTKLADAESFLFHVLRAVPSAFMRLNAMLFRMNYSPEIAHHKDSLHTLESASKELRARGLFVKLLEAILKAGNRMNAGTARGNAQAFNLTALRKLSDVKSIDGKTTLLHFVVQEVVRSEGKRAALNNKSSETGELNSEISDASNSKEEQEKEYIRLGLPIVGGLSSEFMNVKKAAGIDYDAFAATILTLSTRVKETKRLLDQKISEEGEEREDGFLRKLGVFLESAEGELKEVKDDQSRIMEIVERTREYYQAGVVNGNNPFQLFAIIKDFLGMVDKVCSEIVRNQHKKTATTTTNAADTSNSAGERNAVRFPILPPNFMSEHYRDSSSDPDSDSDSDSGEETR